MTPRRGWTIHEMLVALCVMSGVVALVTSVALGQLRFFRGSGEIAATRSQLTQGADIIAGVLWSASATGGDIVAAHDSAIEVRATIGAAVTCAAATGALVMPAPDAATAGNTFAAFTANPDGGDAVDVFVEDSTGRAWITLQTAGPPTTADRCDLPLTQGRVWAVPLREQIPIAAGAPVRFIRPIRVSLYKASDNRWYVGAKDWNGASQRLNTIQPVAGPLRPYSANSSKSGLTFTYRDSLGSIVAGSTSQIAAVTAVLRGETLRPVRVRGIAVQSNGLYADSLSITIALRNH